jgi:hypothetical protein
MKEIHVDIIQPELVQAGLEGTHRLIVPVVRDPKFGRDEEIGAGEFTACDPLPTSASLP